MTHPCCPSCRLRFAHTGNDLAPCPMCGEASVLLAPSDAVGFQRYAPELPDALAAAVAAQMPAHMPRGSR